MKKIRLLLLCIGSILSWCSIAFSQDTLPTKKDTLFYQYFYLNMFDDISGKKTTNIDTIINGFQKYESVSFSQSLGRIGKAHRSYFFSPTIVKGFNIGESSYNSYLTNFDNVKYYNVSTPFSDLYYVMGSGKEQLFNVIHTQNISKTFNVAVNYNIINNIGSFRRQRTDISNFILSSHYTGKKEKYKILGNVVFNKCNNHENGGLLYIQDYNDDLLGRAELYDVRLGSAQNKLKQQGIYFKQFYSFNKKTVNPDDSSSIKPNPIFRNRIAHEFNFVKRSRMYEDLSPLSGFYPNAFFSQDFTGDSIKYNKISNEVSVAHSFFKKSNTPLAYLEIALQHQYIDFRQLTGLLTDSVVYVLQEKAYINQFIPNAHLFIKPLSYAEINFKGYHISGDYNEGDYGISADVNLTLSNHYIFFGASTDNYSPAYIYNKYTSNHFTWNYNFENSNNLCISAKHIYKTLETTLKFITIDNHIYFDKYARPKQYSNSIQVLHASVNKKFELGRFNFDSEIIAQKSGNKNILPIPLFATQQSLYYNTYMFKKALFAQIGIDFYYNTSYFGYNYMPATQQFYLQDYTLTGNYPIFDAFINLYIKNARIFIKAHHLNEGYIGSNNYSVLGYPLQGMSFKFGVSWQFRD